MTYGTLGVLVAIYLSVPAWGQELKTPSAAPRQHSGTEIPAAIPVRKADPPPIVDGMLEDPVWKDATSVTDFKQRLPVEGADPTVRTHVSLVYTSRALYVAVRAFHEDSDDIVATAMRRDDFEQVVNNEQFVIAIDSYNDGRDGYWFSTNPLGVRVDAQFFNDGDLWEWNWDGVWDCEAVIDAEGWTAELEIPFSTLRFAEGPLNVMGINLFRRVIATNEQLFAPLIPLRLAWGTPNVSAARKYLFTGISGDRRLQVKPFGVAGLANADASSQAGLDAEMDVGIDARFGLNDNLTATVTVNTDFAQAEVDERQINLTRFSLFFPEKRDFFLENAGTFSFGRPQEADVFFSRTIGLARNESGGLTEVPILAGGKITGKVGRADVGFLDVQMRPSTLTPAQNAAVARVKIGIAPRSYVGGIASANGTSEDVYYAAYGADVLLYPWNDIGLSGFAAMSANSDEPLERGASSAFSVGIFKGGERTSFDVHVLDVGSAFHPALGFVPRRGIRKWSGMMKVPLYRQSGPIRRIVPDFATSYYVGHDETLETSTHEIEIALETWSDDRAVFRGSRSFEFLPVGFSIFNDVAIPHGRYTFFDVGLELSTKPGRRAWGTLSINGGSFYGGSRLVAQLAAEWKANRHLTVSQFYETSDIDLPDGSFRSHLVRSRLNFALNTHLSVAGLGQYDNASERLGLHLRLSYLFREGTEFFLVYNDTFDRSNFGDRFNPGRLQSRTILLKFTYLFNV